MKKSIKAITAAISAAVLCAIPVANSFTANAAATKKTYKITYLSTKTNNGYTSVKLNAYKASTMNFSTQSLGFVNNGRLMGGAYNGNNAYVYWCSTVNNGLGEVGVLADWYINTTNSNAKLYQITPSYNAMTGVTAYKVRLGDLTGAKTQTEDDVDVADAVLYARLLNKNYIDAPTNNIKQYIFSKSFYQLDLQVLRMMLAADINGDYKLTENERTVILRHIAKFDAYADLEHFLGWSDAQLGSYNAAHTNG